MRLNYKYTVTINYEIQLVTFISLIYDISIILHLCNVNLQISLLVVTLYNHINIYSHVLIIYCIDNFVEAPLHPENEDQIFIIHLSRMSNKQYMELNLVAKHSS